MNNKSYKFLIPGLIGILIIIFIIGFSKEKFSNTTSADSEVSTTQTISNDETKKTATKTCQSDSDLQSNDNRFEGLNLINDNRGVPVLYYHSIDSSMQNEVILSPEKLKEQLTYIKDSGYTTLTISELNDYIVNNKEIPEKSIVITFDDGYMDNYINAFPILKELNMKATIFVISDGINDGYYLSSDQLKELSDYGIDIQSHTKSHCHLNTLSYEDQLKELEESKKKLEDILGKKVISIAYPFGDYNSDSIKAAKEAGYTLAFTTNNGYAKRTSNLELNRIYVSSAYSFDTFKSRLQAN